MESLIMNNNTKPIHVLMFPWLAHGHISPYFELAKRLSKRNFIIHICSTPANLSSIKKKMTQKLATSIRLVEFYLPTTFPDLPPCYHTTNGLPSHLMPTLKQAFEMARPNFYRVISSIKPDLLVYDFLQPWAPVVASGLNIPAVMFITGSSTMTAYMFHFFKSPKVEFPFESIFYRDYESVHRENMLASSEKVKKEAFDGIMKSNEIVLIKGFREIEGPYVDYLSTLLSKRIVPVGALVQDPSHDHSESTKFLDWLDKKGKKSTIFVSFGSEYFLKQEDLEELAYGLELSNVNFIWALRFPKGETTILENVLPKGFLDRVGDRGLVVEGWAPQAKILGHKSIGGFVSHCGCSSIMESMKFGVPIIAMPMHIDQPLNARLVSQLGVGIEIVRNDFGVLEKEKVAAAIRMVVVEDEGEDVRKKAMEMSEKISAKGDEEIDQVVEEFVKLCDNGNLPKKKKKSEWFKIAKNILGFNFKLIG